MHSEHWPSPPWHDPLPEHGVPHMEAGGGWHLPDRQRVQLPDSAAQVRSSAQATALQLDCQAPQPASRSVGWQVQHCLPVSDCAQGPVEEPLKRQAESTP